MKGAGGAGFCVTRDINITENQVTGQFCPEAGKVEPSSPSPLSPVSGTASWLCLFFGFFSARCFSAFTWRAPPTHASAVYRHGSARLRFRCHFRPRFLSAARAAGRLHEGARRVRCFASTLCFSLAATRSGHHVVCARLLLREGLENFTWQVGVSGLLRVIPGMGERDARGGGRGGPEGAQTGRVGP